MSVNERVQEAAEDGNIIVGTEESLKHLDDIELLVIASNAPYDLQEHVSRKAEDAGTDVQKLDVDNQELGSLCMKPFTASVVGITQ